MNPHQLLGELSQLQGMMTDLLLSVDENKAYSSYQPDLPPMAWLLGRCVYMETYWIREVIQQDDNMTSRVRAIFGQQAELSESLWKSMPPRDHLLNWALELQEQNLTLLANPKQLPEHELVKNDQLLWLIYDEYAKAYEQMLMQVHEIGLHTYQPFNSTQPLQALAPSEAHTEIHGGHYRIGAKPDQADARDIELPTQVVELSAYRIDTLPVSNGAWLSFIQAGGYQTQSFWSEEGWQWLQSRDKKTPDAPHTWRQDKQNNWYSIALNGPCELIAEEPVSGINYYEASAYANWASELNERLKGAVIQHEFQWEAAKRTGSLISSGQVWEWCSNAIEPYSGFKDSGFKDSGLNNSIYEEGLNKKAFDHGNIAIRSASMHTPRLIRRPRYRNYGKPDQRFMLTGTRLVFPPSDMPWHYL
jgi:iron(II)-dependent oxidoreductase